MSLILEAELAAACNALGSFDSKTNAYYGDDNILETVKDLIRYLRRDTESHEIRRYFGAAKILQLNLIPLLKLYWEQTDLFDVLLRLLGNLTSPVLLLYNEEIPKEKTVRNHFLQILSHLQSYKEAFADYDLWAVLCTRLSKLLNIEWQERGEENGLIIERILILVRNVLSVPADPDAEKRPDNDVSAHDKVLWSLRKSGLVDIIHYMVSSDQEECYYMYLLEILSLMLREHRPSDLANAANVRTESEKAQDEAAFLSIRRQEMARKNERFKSYTSARHSRFGGTFVFKDVKSVNDSQELIYHKALNKANVLDFDADKSKVKVPKNRLPLHESPSFRRSTFSIRLLLKDFCIEFLNSGYNKLMQNARGKLVRGKSVAHDETYYLWALRFFMEFNRHYKFDVKLVSETMSIQIFHYVQQQMEHNFDMVSSDKKKWPLWSKRLHLALQAYKELLLNLAAMEKSEDGSVKSSAKVIRSNVFYVLEYREFLLTLLLTYNAQKMSDAYLLDLLETQHIFLKMLQGFCGKDTSIVVQNRQKIKKKKTKQPAAAPVVSLEEGLEMMWDELSSQISTVLEGGENIPVVVPFDAASEVPINDQKKDAMIKIQNFLRENEIENAIGLLRASRDVWPDNDSFGSSSMTPEEEFLAIREIFFAKLRDSEEKASQPTNTNDEDEENEEEDDEEEMEIEREVDFKFQDFVSRFAHPKVIQACGLALRHFETNPMPVNHCILKLLHRIAWDCRMPAMIFQASIFRTFQRIFAEKHRPEFKELVKFAIYIIRQFVKVTEKNKKVFMELLFWKNNKEAYDTEEGYGSYQNKSKAMKAAWTEQEEDELRVLVIEYRQKEIEEDAIDWISNNLIDNTKTRRMIIKKLKQMMLMDYKGPTKKNVVSSRVTKDWDEHEIVQLTELYNQFKDARDPLGCIVDRLDVKRPKGRVKQKILDLGLAEDSKALRKKRSTKSGGQNEDFDRFRSNADSEELDTATSSSDESTKDNRSNNLNNTNRSITKSSNRSINKKIIKPSKFNFITAKKNLLELIDQGMTDSLKWISECLSEAAEDQEQDIDLDDNEGIPLVAICEKDVLAMEDSSFKKMLTAVGIKKPASEQEMYWRIPGNILAPELLKIANFIKEVIEKGAEVAEEPSVAPEAESSDEDVFDRLRSFITKSDNEESPNPSQIEVKNNRKVTANEQSESNITDIEITELNLENGMISSTNVLNKIEESIIKKTKTKRIQVMSESDESDVENTPLESNPNSDNEEHQQSDVYKKNIFKKKLKSTRILEESDDSDVENNSNDAVNAEENILNKMSKSTHVLEGSDNSDVENNSNEVDNAKENVSNKISKSVLVLEDSGESNSEKNVQEALSKRPRESESDSEHNIKRKRIAIIDSDDE